MTQEEKYFNFMRNYNNALKNSGSNWLGPKELGDVVLGSAIQNMVLEQQEKAGKKNVNNHSTTK